MAQTIFAVIFFGLGYFVHKHRFNEIHKKFMFSTSKLIEINFFIVLKNFIEMHLYGIKALRLTLEKCTEENPEKAEEYKKFCEVYERKFDYFGNHYFSIMKNIFPFDLKYNSYKQVKEETENLINK